MGYKIAVATSDGVNVDLHFGAANTFAIYDVEGQDYKKTETKVIPASEGSPSQGCCSNSECGNRSSCDSGCSDRKGCHGGEKSPAVEMLSNCRCIVCTKVGRNIIRQFERLAISTFDITMPINEALPKIIGYYHKIDKRKQNYKYQEG